MKNNFFKIISIFTIVLIVSCNKNSREIKNVDEQNPKALQDDSSLKRYSKRGVVFFLTIKHWA